MNKRAALFMGLFALAFFHAAPPASADSCEAAAVRKDYKTAYRLCLPLAEKGEASAQGFLGWMYANGWGVGKDYRKALLWYYKAADQGNASAQVLLGRMYYEGKGVPKDYQRAARLYRKAADQGDAWAQGVLGLMYHLGWGVPKDYVKAYKWCNLASARGHESALVCLNLLEQSMTQEQIAEGQRLSRNWQPNANSDK